MIGRTILHYTILSKLGEGGMGVVYKAHDTRLDRDVALKFLPSDASSSDADRTRFLQEARSAAALNHPNVCSVIDIQEAGGQQFIVMEYVDGETLRRKVAVKSIEQALQYAVQIGEALQTAHAKGIVHRDVKCDNIMVTSDGRIKVMDFGLAKLKGSLKLTRTSSTVGTLAYMAPEQIQGGEVDARSDIFSFGVVLFEMLTGKMPFRGEHEAAMMYSILNEEPESVLTFLPGSPPDIGRIIGRALEKNPEDRYQHVDDMVSELRLVQKQSGRVGRPAAAAQSQTRDKNGNQGLPARKRVMIAAGIVIVLAAAVFIFLRTGRVGPAEPGSGKKMLVVLPFENLGSPDQEYFADGLTEEITSKLSGLSGLGVIARSSAMQYKKSSKSLQQIGSELGVVYILQGTIRWESSNGTTRVRVTPQLINVSDGTQIWSQPSDAVMASAFTLQSDISGQVAAALDITLLQGEKQSLSEKPTSNSEAYDYFLRGSEFMSRSNEERDYKFAEPMFQRAVELDPKFALAWARLAELDSHIYWEMYDHTPERAGKSKEAADNAMQYGPGLPESHLALGFYYYHCLRDYDNALKEFSAALEKQPGNSDVLLGIGSVDRRMGKFDDALVYFQRIAEVDPRSSKMLAEVATTYGLMRKYPEADQAYRRAIEISPDVAELYAERIGMLLLWKGKDAPIAPVIQEAVQRHVGQEFPLYSAFWIRGLIVTGKITEASRLLDSMNFTSSIVQEWYGPRDLLVAEICGYLHQPAREKAAYEAARLECERQLLNHPGDPRVRCALGIAYAGLGRTEDAIREGIAGANYMPMSKEAFLVPLRMLELARIYTMTGKQEQALDILEKLLSVPSYISVPMLRSDPIWTPLRNNPRFQKLIAVNG